MIPENNSKAIKAEMSKEESKEMRQVNYERYRILIQNEYLSIGEEKFLKTIDMEEKFGGTTYQGNRAKEEKKKSSNKAAIGFIYQDPEACINNFEWRGEECLLAHNSQSRLSAHDIRNIGLSLELEDTLTFMDNIYNSFILDIF